MSLRNERDNFVQGNPPRLLPVGLPPNLDVPGLKTVLLTSTGTVFKINVDGQVVGPTQIVINSVMRAIEGTPVFSVASGEATLVSGSNPNQKLLNFSDMESEVVTITVTVEDINTFRPTGTEPLDVFTDSLTLSKVKDGSIGSRGAGHYYTFGHSWSNAAATAATPDGAPVLDDMVTIANGSTFALTRRWNGNSWVNIGKVIDGNLLVTGSVNAAAINSNGLTIRDPYGNIILHAGGGAALDYGYVGGTKPPANATVNTGAFANLAGKLTPGNISTFLDPNTVTGTYIANLTVSALKIQNEAVTIPRTNTGSTISGSIYSATGTTSNLYIPSGGVGYNPAVLIVWSLEQGYSGAGGMWSYRLERRVNNGTWSAIKTRDVYMHELNDQPTGQFLDTNVSGNNNYAYRLLWRGVAYDGGSISAQGTITALGVGK